jgi:hypothetical protein
MAALRLAFCTVVLSFKHKKSYPDRFPISLLQGERTSLLFRKGELKTHKHNENKKQQKRSYI